VSVTIILAFLLGLAVSGVGCFFASRRWEKAERKRSLTLHSDLHEGNLKREELSVKLAQAERLIDSVPLPLFLLDHRSQVLRKNAAAEALVLQDAAGRAFASGFRQPNLVAAIDSVLETGKAATVDLTMQSGTERAFLVRVEPIAAPPTPDTRESDGSNRHRNRKKEKELEPAVVIAMQDITSVVQTERMRADFVANVSHELRTPLSSLIGFIETLRGPARDDREAHDRFLAIMQEQADRMFRLIADLLSLSRIELEEHSLPNDAVNMIDVVHSVTDTVTLKAQERGMKIELDMPDILPPVTGDQDQLTQVLQNLVDNALKYGRDGTPVTIASTVSEKTLTISVRDRGLGIPKDHLPRLTERFYRVDAARSRELGGTGLGLAIVKHIVNRHRGKFSIQSEQGEGSCFSVSLPLR